MHKAEKDANLMDGSATVRFATRKAERITIEEAALIHLDFTH